MTVAARVASGAVVGLLLAVAAAAAWFGGFLTAQAFTPGYKDSDYLLLGTPFLAVAAAAATAARLLVRPSVTQRGRGVGTVLAALLFVLPGAIGVLTAAVSAAEAERRWRVYESPSGGYTLRYPPGWTLFPPTRPDQPPETVTLTSWSATAPGGAVPAGGLKVTLGPSAGPPPTGAPFAVGEGRYPGTTSVPPPAGSGGSGGAHTVAIVYAAGRQTWQISGAFAEPPDGANPNTAVFSGIVASLRHRP